MHSELHFNILRTCPGLINIIIALAAKRHFDQHDDVIFLFSLLTTNKRHIS